jgi:hypothetical protein
MKEYLTNGADVLGAGLGLIDTFKVMESERSISEVEVPIVSLVNGNCVTQFGGGI